MSAAFDVLCCSLTQIDADLRRRYTDLLNEEELKRLHSFRSSSGAQEFLVGRALLRTALATRLNCNARELQFSKNDDGKPALAYPDSHWQFNLTHSHDWIALAVCESGAVGIDVESHKRRNNLAAIAGRFFSKAENEQLTRCTQDEWLDYFFAVWTLKEAHAKALGCGLPKILACSSVAVDLDKGTIDLDLNGIARTENEVSSWLYRLDADSSLAVIVHGSDFVEPQIFRCVPERLTEELFLSRRAHGKLRSEVMGE